MAKYVVAGNWKMNKLPSETYDFVKSVAAATENAGKAGRAGTEFQDQAGGNRGEIPSQGRRVQSKGPGKPAHVPGRSRPSAGGGRRAWADAPEGS